MIDMVICVIVLCVIVLVAANMDAIDVWWNGAV